VEDHLLRQRLLEAPLAASPRASNGSRLLDWLFFACLFCATFEKVHWDVAGAITLTDVLTVVFALAYTAGRLGRRGRPAPRSEVVVLAFGLAFLLVYLLGFFNLETKQALDQWTKGLGKFFLHFGFLAFGLAYLVRRSERFYWRAITAFMAGIAANAAYGVLQLAVAQAGGNLDDALVNPLTGGASKINLYGQVNGTSVYRPNALTGDPNHLGIVLCVPLLVLTPIYLRLERRHRLRTPLGLLLAFLLLVELTTLSRSGVLGLLAGVLVLLLAYARRLVSWAVAGPLAAVAGVIAVVALVKGHYLRTVLEARVQTGNESTSTHLGVYDFIPQIIHQHPLLGLGLNNFSVYYELVTGRTNWGPHSFYVALFVDTGLVGVAVFAVFLWYFFRRLAAARAVGRELAAQRDPAAARVRPLAWGMTAALIATMASNAFYLTMTFFYFYAFVMLIVAAPIVLGRRVVWNRLIAPAPA
jgi:O-Antigen ligase